MRFSFASLRTRLLLLVLLAVIPALGLTIYTNLELRQWAAVNVHQETLRVARLAANDQEDTIKDTRQLLFALAQLPDVYDTDARTCSSFFSQLSKQYPQYASLGVITPGGHIFCSAQSTETPLSVADQEYFRRTLETREFTIGSYQNDLITDKATLNFGYPVFDDVGRVRAIVFASLDLTWLNQLAAEAQLPAGSTITVVDRNGTVLVRYPDPGVWVGQSVPEAPIVERILSQQGEGTTEADGVDGVSRLFAFAPLYGTPESAEVYISVGIPTSVAFADTNRVLLRNLATLGLVTLFSLAAVWLVSDYFVLRWVRRLVEATQRLSAGDVRVRTGLPYGQGELSQLALAFDEMADSLERGVTQRDIAEAALRESQRTLSTLMSNLPGIAYRCRNDRNRTMEFISEGCLALTGYEPSDLMMNHRATYAQLIHPEDRKAVWFETQEAIREHRMFQIVYRIKTISKEIKWVWEQGQGVYSTRDQLIALEGFITDTTERIEAYHLLEQRVADRTRELSALYDVTAVASKSLHLTDTLEQSLEQVLTVMGCKAGTIHLLDETQQTLGLAVQRGVPEETTAKMKALLPGEGLPGWVIAHDESLVVPDIATDTRFPQPTFIEGFQAYLGVPMRSRGRVLGVLSVLGEAGQQFKMEEVALLASIADQVGVAVENSQLYEAERTRRHQADTMLQVASVVGSTIELNEVLARILDQLRRVVDYDSASVQLLEERNQLRVIAVRGFADVEQILGTMLSLNNTPNYTVVFEGKAVNLPNAPALYPAFRHPPFNHIRSWLGVPLRIQDRIIGIITIDRQQAGGYSEEQVRLTTAFADLAALALENARLYQQTEQLAVMEERSRLARELHDSVTQSLYSLTLFAEVARRSVAADNFDEVTDYVTRLKHVSQQALKEMRLLVYELRTAALETEGLIGALQQRLDSVEKRAGVEARLLVESMVELPAVVEEGLYRIAQEALNNSLKHAAATQVTLRIRADEAQITVEVKDNGVAFDPQDAGNSGGLGLTTMRERAERLGGTLEILSNPGEGTTVLAHVPTRRSSSRPLLPVDKLSEVSP